MGRGCWRWCFLLSPPEHPYPWRLSQYWLCAVVRCQGSHEPTAASQLPSSALFPLASRQPSLANDVSDFLKTRKSLNTPMKRFVSWPKGHLKATSGDCVFVSLLTHTYKMTGWMCGSDAHTVLPSTSGRLYFQWVWNGAHVQEAGTSQGYSTEIPWEGLGTSGTLLPSPTEICPFPMDLWEYASFPPWELLSLGVGCSQDWKRPLSGLERKPGNEYDAMYCQLSGPRIAWDANAGHTCEGLSRWS